MGKTGNVSFEEKKQKTFFCSPGPGPCPWSYTNMCNSTLIKMSPDFCPWKFLTVTSVLGI